MWNFKGTFWNPAQNILPLHWKIWFLYNIEILRALRFKSSYTFLKHPPVGLLKVFNSVVHLCSLGTTGIAMGMFCETLERNQYSMNYLCSIGSHTVETLYNTINYIPRIRRIGGCYGFTSKPPAARHPPPAMVLTRLLKNHGTDCSQIWYTHW